MADNYTANVGVGLQFAADDVGGVLHPRVKLSLGVDGVATDVSSSNPVPVKASHLDLGLSTSLWLSGGINVLQPAMLLVTSETYGIARISSRRAWIQAPDMSLIRIDDRAPTPDYSDLTQLSGDPVSSSDLAIRDTDDHYVVVPMAWAQWRRLIVSIDHRDAVFDQAVTWWLYGSLPIDATTPGSLGAEVNALLATAIISAGYQYPFSIGESAVGQGGTTGGATVANNAYYPVPALNAGWPYVILRLKAAVAPSDGNLEITVTRMST